MEQFKEIGEKYGHYVVTHLTEIPEIQSTLIELVHEPTGAQIMQIANDDEENLFNLSLCTRPESSNGVAHILEHTVLCGSKKFPVRDPFFSMAGRSLNTFMNALTGADFTCYPAATQVPKDFYNLLEVYLDAVFHPNLAELSFLQEGHRIEFLKPDDPNSPLVFKGIVFNEMKGALATPDARLSESIMQALFPNITYGVNSGGEPLEILSLTYEELKAFHAHYYHPSRCLFYFYGNLPLKRHLDFLQQHIFEGADKLDPLPQLQSQPRFNKSVEKNLTYPIHEEGETEDKSLVALGWLTCSILEQEDLLALNVLDVVLTGTDAAPLKQALLKSGLCKQADSLIETEMSEIPFVVICKGCAQISAEEIERITRSILSQLAEEGIPAHLIEAAIHQIEMARLEITGNSTPYGLALFFRSALLKQHGGHAEDGLKIHTLFNRLKEKVKEKEYFPRLIHKYFLNNPHFVRIAMHPSTTLAQEEMQKEQDLLDERARSLTDADIRKIIAQAKELEAYQESAKEENCACLPKVTLTDVKEKNKEFELSEEEWGNFKIFRHECFTNGLLYTDLIFDLPLIEADELSYLRLFTLLLPQVGCGGRSYQQHLEYLLEHTGGAQASLDLCLSAIGSNHMRPCLTIRSKALSHKADKLFPLLRDLVSTADFTDTARLHELLMQHLHGMENSIHSSSLRYAVNLAAQGFSVASKIINSWYGLDYFWALKKIVKEFEENPAFLVEQLQKLQQRTLGLKGAHLVLSCEPQVYDLLKSEGFYGLNAIKADPFTPWSCAYPLAEKLSQARITSSPVAFTALLLSSVNYTHPHAAALSIASEIMENHYLHKKIREKGGAYGCGAVNSLLSEQFYFYAYRDPHIKASLKAFHDAVAMVAGGKFKDKDIEEAKLSLFQDMDSPIPPASRAMTSYLRLRGDRTVERRQNFRDALRSCQKEQICQAVQDHIVAALKESVAVSFAAKELLEKENHLLKENALPVYLI